MAQNLLGRYVWLIDTIRRYGSITRGKLNELWVRSGVGDGNPLPRRTFYNYREAIEELFGITIEVNPRTYEYYIASDGDEHKEGMTDWLLNSAAMSNVLSNVSDVSDRIFLEDVPSSRTCLSQVISALRDRHPIRFTYSPYTRSKPSPGVVIDPYFLKIFRQRWYITGLNHADERIKTYALDRMLDVAILDETFTETEDFELAEYVADTFGIIFSSGATHEVVLRTDTRQAKYFRTLPLHPSQREIIHDDFSEFHLRLRLTADFVGELLSLGPRVKVISPPELRAMVIADLRAALEQYEGSL